MNRLLQYIELTISFRKRARAASRLAGLFASKLSALLRPRLRSSWIMVFFAYILSISLQEPPLEFSKPLKLFGSGGSPSMQASVPPAVLFDDLPFILQYQHTNYNTLRRLEEITLALRGITAFMRYPDKNTE